MLCMCNGAFFKIAFLFLQLPGITDLLVKFERKELKSDETLTE